MPEIGVLLVEDERLLDRVVADALRTIGLSCETVVSVDEALQRLQQNRYLLLILDLRLRSGSGIEVLQYARRMVPQMPVILITAYMATGEVHQALTIGVDAVLYKPFDIDTLLATVRRLLSACVPSFSTGLGAGRGLSCWLRSGAIALLKTGTQAVVCRAHSVDEYWFSADTERFDPPYPQAWTVEWTGSDGLYSFRTRVIEVAAQEESLRWVLQLPRVIRRQQRRRHPRLQVAGHALVSIAGRPQRGLEADLLDVSVAGACIALSEPLHRNATVYLDAQAVTEVGSLAFQREGVVRSVVAYVEHGVPRYRVGVQLQPLPVKARQVLSALRRHRLFAP